MAWSSKREKEYQKIRMQTMEGKGGERTDKIHEKGRLTARERLSLLFDGQQYAELEMYARSRSDFGEIEKTHYHGDGVIAAFGKVEGKIVYAAAQDRTVSGGSGGEIHVKKICRTLEKAIETGSPFIFLCESGGARIEEGIFSLAAYSRLFYLNTKASGWIPQIAAIMGNCAGGSSYSPAMCDFVFMIKNTSQFFITGPRVIKALTGETVTMDELGGADIHSKYSGQAHFVSNNDTECIRDIRNLLSYIVNRTTSYQSDITFYRNLGKEIEDIVPENTRKSYDVRDVIVRIVDEQAFMEIQTLFAPNIVCGFSRLDGNTIGIVANQPDRLGGSLDCDAADKCARFVRFCDCFQIPLLVLTDVPGFYPGVLQEKKGILRHGCKMLYAFSEAVVPKITLIMRKAYGGAYCAMNSKELGADYVFAWPLCEIAVMGADGAVDVLFKKQMRQVEDPQAFRKDKIKKYEEKYLNPYFAASCGMIDEVICPQETREKLILAYEGIERKCMSVIEKRHGNIAL